MPTPPAGWPRIAPVAPQSGGPVPITGSPFWIGAATDAGLPLFLPGVAARHLAVIERADGLYLLPQRGVVPSPTLNGEPIDGTRRLHDGDVVGLLPGVAYRIELAPAPVARPAAPVAAPMPTPTPALTEPRVGFWLRIRRTWRRWRDRARRTGPRGGTRWLGWALGVTATLLIVGAGVLVWRAVFPSESGVPAALSEADARAYDAVAAQAEDHIERGSTLLEIGLPDPALREFGAAVTTLESTPLRSNPWVRPRIDALEAGIAAIYRERRVAVPTRFARAAAPARPTNGAPVPLAREARLSTTEFSTHLEQVRSAFSARFGRELVVTGRDHAEHVALYGPGGAADLRVRDLPPDQVQFVVAQLRTAGMRVKDFSTDAVLQAQVASARAAGLADRASTGLHLHTDRFVDRVDRWTVR